MSGRRSQRKGKDGEIAVTNDLKNMGLDARRTAPLQAGFGRMSDVADVEVRCGGQRYMVEVKRTATGWATLYKALGSADMLVVRVDRERPVYCLSEDMARIVLPLLVEAAKRGELQ
jgi:hypothetical protein